MSKNIINHRVFNDVDLALIQGTTVKPICGEAPFVPHLRIGSGGRADEPSAPTCERCERAHKLILARRKLKDEYNRIARVMRQLQKEYTEIGNGKPLRTTEIPAVIFASLEEAPEGGERTLRASA